MPDIHKLYAPISGYFRSKRYERFLAAFPPCRVLDFGGSAQTWSAMPRFDVTLLNLDASISRSGLKFAVADACEAPFGDRSFDLAFSNSVIEHVGDWSRQQAFAREMQRVADAIYCQTPNFRFPIEPHLLTPFVHWIPGFCQNYFCVRYFTVTGWITKLCRQRFESEYRSVRLLKKRELRVLFPGCEIWEERVWGLIKSFCVVRRDKPTAVRTASRNSLTTETKAAG